MRLRPAAAVLAVALTAAACASADTELAEPAAASDGSQGVEEVSTTAPAEDTALDAPDDEAGPPTAEALWWTAETVADGSQFTAADLAGEQVVLWMWAPWCSVCNREAPDVAEALADLPPDVTLIGVAGRDDVGPMRDFVAEHGLQGMTHVVDADGAVWSSYGISYQPAWVFIDAEGNASVAAGALGYDGLFAALDEVFAD